MYTPANMYTLWNEFKTQILSLFFLVFSNDWNVTLRDIACCSNFKLVWQLLHKCQVPKAKTDIKILIIDSELLDILLTSDAPLTSIH